jgi:hypothetical protein
MPRGVFIQRLVSIVSSDPLTPFADQRKPVMSVIDKPFGTLREQRDAIEFRNNDLPERSGREAVALGCNHEANGLTGLLPPRNTPSAAGRGGISANFALFVRHQTTKTLFPNVDTNEVQIKK